MIGVTGTMISLIPNMGGRVLGSSRITGADNFLPFFLSVIIFFGSLFLTICFLLIFSRIFEGRYSENIEHRITPLNKIAITWYEGDLQRFILLFCLVPMWIGLTLFFLILMPMIPNRFSWLFAVVIVLTFIPLAVYSFLGWNAAKTLMKNIPGMNRSPRLSMAVVTLVVILILLLIPFSFPSLFNNTENFSGNIQIRTDQQYYSPLVSSAKGLRLELTNLSGRELLASRHTWSADYGYFIRITPSTSEVTVLGNPVSDDNSQDIYWTYPSQDPVQNKKPIKIGVTLYPLQGTGEITNSSLYLTWYTPDIVYVNRSYQPPQ